MFHALVVLSELDCANGSGVGLSHLCSVTGLSKFKMRKLLKDMLSVGMIARRGNLYVLALLGANMSVADRACAAGYGVGFAEQNSDYMPIFQKGF